MSEGLTGPKYWLSATKRRIDALDSAAAKKAVEDLTQFIEGDEGQSAIHHLLRVTERHIVFGKTDPVHPGDYPTVYALTGGMSGGLVRTVVRSDGNLIETDYATLEPISTTQAVKVAIILGNKAPYQIMKWLRDELDEIAKSIPY